MVTQPPDADKTEAEGAGEWSYTTYSGQAACPDCLALEESGSHYSWCRTYPERKPVQP